MKLDVNSVSESRVFQSSSVHVHMKTGWCLQCLTNHKHGETLQRSLLYHGGADKSNTVPAAKSHKGILAENCRLSLWAYTVQFDENLCLWYWMSSGTSKRLHLSLKTPPLMIHAPTSTASCKNGRAVFQKIWLVRRRCFCTCWSLNQNKTFYLAG